MITRRAVLFVFLGIVASPSLLWGAKYRTTNFEVEAPTQQSAEQIGQYAEHYRKEKALQWLGQEMPPWPQPCPLHVKVTTSGAGGATSFAFDQGRVLGQNMHIEGSLDRLLSSVLPHEVTHTVFAYYFRCPVPRWADEGGAVLSEDDVERDRHDRLVRDILNKGRAYPLRRLFSLREYPPEVMNLYAEGFSVANFLVGQSNRPAFLAFVAQGMRDGWDKAAQVHYRYNNVDELEQAWLTHLRNTKRQPTQLANNTGPTEADPARRVVERKTAPPAQPSLDAPRIIYRGVSSGPDDGAGWDRPRSLPEPNSSAPDHEQPSPVPGSVRLLPPEYLNTPPAQLGRPVPGPVSPVGYPR